MTIAHITINCKGDLGRKRVWGGHWSTGQENGREGYENQSQNSTFASAIIEPVTYL